MKKMDGRYQEEHGIQLLFEKKVVSSVLGTERTSSGEIWLDKGKMRLEVFKPTPSKIVADKSFLWIESPAPVGFEDVKTQVLKTSLGSKQAKSQGLIQILTGGGLLKYFKVSGVQRSEKNLGFFLQPGKQAVEFKRAQLQVNKKTYELEELRYWDQMDNQTTYNFKQTKFNLKVDGDKFKYNPPADAKVIVY